MKVILIHKFHYLKGGTETFHYNLADALIAAGHEVIFFSMYDEKNIPCAQDKYFVSNVDYNNSEVGFVTKIRNGLKLIYSFEAKRNIEQLIKDEKPDIAHIGLLHRQITFSVVDALKKNNIPIVMHLHDLISVCPCYTMLRQDGTVCRDCIDKSSFSCVRNKCLKGSKAKSFLAYLEAKFLKFGGYYNKIDLYIAECNFYKNLLSDSGFTKTRIVKMNNFLPVNQKYESYAEYEDYILYFGRFSREKGIMVILEAFSNIKCKEKLMIVGAGPEKKNIEEMIINCNLSERIILGEATFGEKMDGIIEKAKAVLVPSAWYENGAFVILQSMARGKIVIASDIAGLSEIIEDGKTGFLAQPGDVESFTNAINKVLKMDQAEVKRMSYNVVEYAKERCYWENYLNTLVLEYEQLLYQIDK